MLSMLCNIPQKVQKASLLVSSTQWHASGVLKHVTRKHRKNPDREKTYPDALLRLVGTLPDRRRCDSSRSLSVFRHTSSTNSFMTLWICTKDVTIHNVYTDTDDIQTLWTYTKDVTIHKHREHTRRMWSYAYTNTVNAQRTQRLWHAKRLWPYKNMWHVYIYTNGVTTHKHFDYTKTLTYTNSVTAHKHFDQTKNTWHIHKQCDHTQTLWPDKNMWHIHKQCDHTQTM